MLFPFVSYASNAPIKVEYQVKQNKYNPGLENQSIKVISKVKSIYIKSVAINNGNCKFSDSRMSASCLQRYLGTNEVGKCIKSIPINLSYGESVSISPQNFCKPHVVTVTTNKGSWNFGIN